MQVDRLRLAGFKSFVDPTELTIAPGLTGIVGPNGCGKSNLVDALRWVMGEASARRLRGGEMDDVIFAGSASRPARNIAEVTLTLDNSARDAPFALNDRDTIEVCRRLEREAGSSYRINGRESRARDVQLLFADAATGPHSGALIGQGRIGALIGARPAERRLLLDEAAGTAGLYARRHEAELKLKAAEDNLVRLDDVVATLTAQLDGLRKQARTAQRYRRLGEQIRRAEAQLYDARWHGAEAEAAALAGELREAERAVAAAPRPRRRCRPCARRSPPPPPRCSGSPWRAKRSTASWRGWSRRAARPSGAASSFSPTWRARTCSSPTPTARRRGSPRNAMASSATRRARPPPAGRLRRTGRRRPPTSPPPRPGCCR